MSRNKTLRKQIQGELEVIEKHHRKIKMEYQKRHPDKQLVAKWEKDIANHLRELAKLREALPGGKR